MVVFLLILPTLFIFVALSQIRSFYHIRSLTEVLLLCEVWSPSRKLRYSTIFGRTLGKMTMEWTRIVRCLLLVLCSFAYTSRSFALILIPKLMEKKLLFMI